MSMSADAAMRQASETALVYFDAIRKAVENAYPTASPDAKLAAVVKLCEVAARDYHSASISGSIDNTPWQIALEGIRLIPDALERIADNDT